MGLEPTRCNHHKILSLARLPVPTLPHLLSCCCSLATMYMIPKQHVIVKHFFQLLHIFFVEVFLTQWSVVQEALDHRHIHVFELLLLWLTFHALYDYIHIHGISKL